MDIQQLKGAIFDLDGVITSTQDTHFKAWKSTFDGFLEKNAKNSDYQPFSKDDYLKYVDGKPRYKGVRSFMKSRGIDLPYGEESDKAGEKTICGVGNTKNVKFREFIKSEGVDVYQSTLDFIDMLMERNIRVGVASSSKNCRFILEKTGLTGKFGSIISGIESQNLGLKGKPEPDIFIKAAEEIGLVPSECLMVEDAISGVEAGKKGDFVCVIGVAREDNKDALRSSGADIAVEDMGEVSWKDLEHWFSEGIFQDGWELNYYNFDQTQEKLRETLTTVGNGYFATRGCFAGERASKDVHYPGTYVAGVYNKVPTVIHDRKIYNNDFVNCPNWLIVDFRIGEGNFISIMETDVLAYKHSLDMYKGIMCREITFKDAKGNITTIKTERFASMDNPHLAVIRYHVIPHNYFEPVTLRSTLDGTIANYGVPRYRSLSGNHLNAIDQYGVNGMLFLHVRTNQSDVDIYMYARQKLFVDGDETKEKGMVETSIEAISESFTFECEQDKTYTIEKTVALYTSQDRGVENPKEQGAQTLDAAGSYDRMLKKHRDAWKDIWDKADVIVEGDRFSQKVLRLHIYHLLVTASPHNRNIDAGIPARGLHGEAYRGHIFWDEMFVLPFYDYHFPEISRADLLYRYRRLDAARENAREMGFDGAMYPWQSANDGKEETQIIHYNPVSGEWDPDLSHLQRHVSLAIANNVMRYCRATDDKEFMRDYGAEIMFEIVRFWVSIVKYDEHKKRYVINRVMGPDEFQEKYPGASKGGINNNSYTNVMVSWLLNKVIYFCDHFNRQEIDGILSKLSITQEEIDKWRTVRDNMYVDINEDGILAQFEGYFDLEELDWQHYRNAYGDIHRLDRILKAEGDTPDKYKAAKQADVLMLFYVLSPAQVKKALERMGYETGGELELLKKNYDYYIKRTSHGSTLSYVVHASILKYLDFEDGERFEWFRKALESDIHDTQGGTTEEGIHTGVMAGTLDIVFQSFSGLEYFPDHIVVHPALPRQWYALQFKILHRKRWLHFRYGRSELTVESLSDFEGDYYIQYKGKRHDLKSRGKVRISIN
ncbi:MAG: beta-phosphoglucomutase family hydrolase [Bacteroidales bacterium]